MKFKPLMILACGALLASCSAGNAPVENSKEVPYEGSTSEVVENSSSKQETSNVIDISAPDDYPTSWTEADLEEMAYYIGENVIPFPLGITSNYETDTDYYGEAFLVYDEECGDLCDAYGELLLADGFSYSESDSDEEENYYTYYKTLEDESDLYVQADYTDGYFDVFAWLEIPMETYATFPYEAINENLGTSLNETNFPSFEIDEGESYYLSVYDDSYVLVYGYLSSDVDDSDFEADYEEAFSNMGFSIDEYYDATNETLGVEASWYAEDGLAYLYISVLEAE